MKNTEDAEKEKRGRLTSEKYVVTTVLSANFRPAKAWSAFRAESGLSYLTKILPTPVDCLEPPLGRGTFISSTWPYFSHSSLMSSQISITSLISSANFFISCAHRGIYTFVLLVVN